MVTITSTSAQWGVALGNAVNAIGLITPLAGLDLPSDIALVYRGDDQALDVAISDMDLAGEDTLTSAVLLSLLCDRTAEPHEVPADGDRRGYWADAYPAVAGDQFGSRLWLLAREKQLTASIQRAKTVMEEALAWMVEDGIAQSVSVAAFALGMGKLAAQVQITLSGQSRTFRFTWDDARQVWSLAQQGGSSAV